ncbi:MAG: crotonase/enoyl-CoA hydratase family protein [Pseudomonadota bacterium]
MTSKTLTLTPDDRGVATLTLNRPEKHNVLSAQMIAELAVVAESLGTDPAVRAVILTGAGVSFCAGGDLSWMKEQMTATRVQRMAEARKLAMMLKALNEMPKPLIGRVNGQAYGGGVGMMSVCDVTVGVADAMFGLTETRLGLIPATISPYVMARMGEGLARQVLMSSRRFEADEAVRLNLLARAVPADALNTAVEAEVTPYLACSPEAVARSKRLTRRMGMPITEELIDWTIEQLADTWETADAVEGVSAFFEKRKASWMT